MILIPNLFFGGTMKEYDIITYSEYYEIYIEWRRYNVSAKE